jgi:hypothetical protein
MRSALAFISLYTAICWAGCSLSANGPGTSKPITHELFTAILRKHVDTEGMVNYKALAADSAALNRYLALLEKHHPNDAHWTRDEQLAYWINAYNAFTLRLIVRNYPVASIKDLGGAIYRVNTPWDIKFIAIEGERYHLNNIEHSIIRKQWNEPRIHFALVCAARSCPKLRNEAYEAATLEAQLHDQTVHFFNSPLRNQVHPDTPKVSKLLSWYGGDFKGAAPTLIEYINRYSKVKIKSSAKLAYLEYDWSLNEQRK